MHRPSVASLSRLVRGGKSSLRPWACAVANRDDESGDHPAQRSTAQSSKLLRIYGIILILVPGNLFFNSPISTTSDMIISGGRQPPSSHDDGDHDQANPPAYQESAPPSQLLPSERPTTSPYAPSSRSDPPLEVEKELPPHPSFPDEKSGEREKEGGKEVPAQRALDVFSSMIWGTTSPNQASTSRTAIVQAQDPLNPAPAAFTRPRPKNYAYLPFQPMTMLGTSPKLADGFPLIPPPINSEDETGAGKVNKQHPFVSHDVTEEDWVK